jgi:hypothetical protein
MNTDETWFLNYAERHGGLEPVLGPGATPNPNSSLHYGSVAVQVWSREGQLIERTVENVGPQHYFRTLSQLEERWAEKLAGGYRNAHSVVIADRYLAITYCELGRQTHEQPKPVPGWDVVEGSTEETQPQPEQQQQEGAATLDGRLSAAQLIEQGKARLAELQRTLSDPHCSDFDYWDAYRETVELADYVRTLQYQP